MRNPLEAATTQDTAQQNKTGYLASGKDVARAMRDSMTGENSLEVAAGGDTVKISEEGRARQQSMAAAKEAEKEKGPDGETTPGAKEGVHSGLAASGGGDDMNATERTIQNIKKQIEQVKEQLEEAKQRLAAATATSGGAAGTAVPEQSDKGDPSARAAEAAAAMAQSMGNAMGQNAEAEAIQAEIEMLNQQLQMLQQQLQEAMQGGGTAGATGTAGIGGTATGPSGQGERIAVS